MRPSANALTTLLSAAAVARLLVGAAKASGTHAQSVPLRQTGAPEATSRAEMDAVVKARALSDGRVVVTPLLGARVIMLDSSLQTARTIADTAGLTHGSRPVQLVTVAYPGDSTLLGDPWSNVFLLLDPDGRRVRAVASPRGADAGVVTGAPASRAVIDPAGRLVYRAYFTPGAPTLKDGSFTMPAPPDTYPIIRANFETRRVDTVAIVRMPDGNRVVGASDVKKGFVARNIIQPLPLRDDWAVLADGTIAIVRAQDYHIELVRPDGSREVSPKLPYTWKRISDDEKQAIVDSMRAFVATADSIAHATGKLQAWAHTDVVPVSEIPDYYPSLKPSGVMADRDGSLWVLPATATESAQGLLYDVISSAGRLTERVRLPRGCALAGFDVHSVVFLNCAGADGKFHLQRTRVVS